MALLALIPATTDIDEQSPSGWLTALGLLLLIGAVINEAASVNLSDSFALASKGIDFLSTYLIL